MNLLKFNIKHFFKKGNKDKESSATGVNDAIKRKAAASREQALAADTATKTKSTSDTVAESILPPAVSTTVANLVKKPSIAKVYDFKPSSNYLTLCIFF